MLEIIGWELVVPVQNLFFPFSDLKYAALCCYIFMFYLLNFGTK